MSWSIWAQGSKTHVRKTVEGYKPDSFYPPTEEKQVESAKDLILACVADCADSSAVFVDASGSMQVSIGGSGSPELQYAAMKLEVKAVKLVGMSPND